MNICTSRRKLVGIASVATAILSALGIVVEIVAHHRETHGWLYVFDLDQEWNVPSVYSALLLFAAAALLMLIGAEQRRARRWGYRYWIVLAVIFCFLGCDELFSIHNSAARLVPLWFKHFDLFNRRWALRWIIIGAPFTLVIAIAFLPFLFRLPRRIASGIVLAGIVYVGSALGLEMFGGWWVGKHTRKNWVYSTEVVLEETGEMIGTVMFMSVLLAYIERELNGRARLGSVVLEIESCD